MLDMAISVLFIPFRSQGTGAESIFAG